MYKCHHFFATHYKQSLVFYGTTADNGSTSIEERSGEKYLLCGMGCVVTMVDGVDVFDKYVWSRLPQLKEKLPHGADTTNEITKTRRVYGGYAVGAQIRMFCSDMKLPSTEINVGDPKCWTTTLSGPSEGSFLPIDWSEDTTLQFGLADEQNLLVMQHCGPYDVYFYETLLCITGSNGDDGFISVCFSPSDNNHSFNEHVKCALLSNDLFIISRNKMAKIENVQSCLSLRTVPTGRALEPIPIHFTKITPYMDSTPFVVNNTLFVMGGRDQGFEAFSEIWEHRPREEKWQYIGRLSVGRYGATVVVFTDKNNDQGVFIVGGFYTERNEVGINKKAPCSVIERLPVIKRGRKRSFEEAGLNS